MAKPRPSTVSIVDAPDGLQDVSAFPDAPALQAIRQGLGVYLESIGFTAEHPLLYVRETGDPYVYVQFQISPDGRGFLDETFVYSPTVTEQLHALYDAYGILETAPPEPVHQSETFKFGRPVHATVNALDAYREEEDTFHRAPGGQRGRDRDAAQARARQRRKEKAWRRRWLQCQIKRGRIRPRSFGIPFKGVDIGFHTGPKFNALPLNWDWAAPKSLETGENWYVRDNIKAPAAASRDIWRKIVEPRLPHASGDPEGYHGYESQLGGCEEGMGDEWWYRDTLYWSYKADCQAITYPGGTFFTSSVVGMTADSLSAEFDDLGRNIGFYAEDWLSDRGPTEPIVAETERLSVVREALTDPELSHAVFLYERQSVIALQRRFRHRPSANWRDEFRSEAKKHSFAVRGDALIYKHFFQSLPPWAFDKPGST